MDQVNPIELPTPNIPLLRKAVEWAEAEAAKTDGTCMWNQVYWAQATECGTVFCIAGYTVTAALPNAVLARSRHFDSDYDLRIDGERAYWGDTAQALLGLTVDERYALFDGINDIERVREVAEQIAARAGEKL
jgi:phage gp46-like protein